MLSLLFLTSVVFSEARADDFDLGLGFNYIGAQSGEFDVGWEAQLGYEMLEAKKWHFGAQLHLINGITSRGDVDEDKAYDIEESYMLAYDSQALYLTARPKNWWLQFQLGMVHADYYTTRKDERSIGPAFGLALVAPTKYVTLHMLDFHHYRVNGESFNVYSISMLILFYMH